MKPNNLTPVFLLILTITMLAGCNNEPSKPQAVVINLNEISGATGANDQIKKHIDMLTQRISEEIKALSEELRKEFGDNNAKLGNTPSEYDEKKMQTLKGQLSVRIKQAQIEGNARLKKAKSEVWQSFIDDVMLVAQKVALEHGASIILTASTGVFWHDGSVDITDEVIERMLGSKGAESAGREQS